MNRFRIVLLASAAVAFASSTLAAPRSLTIINKSGEPITALSAQAQADNTPAPVFTAGQTIAVAGKLSVTLDLADNACLVDLIFTLASGKPVVQPSIDLCSADAIVVE